MKITVAIIGVSFVLGIAPASVSALPIAELDVAVQAVIHDLGGMGTASGRIDDESATGPLLAELENGAVFTYDAPNFPPDALEATLFQTVRAQADYGMNSASLKSGLSATSAQDRGDFPSGSLIDLELNSSLAPEMSADSDWVDTFLIEGGTGTGTAVVTVELDGTVQSGYGENGTAFYDETSGTFEAFGRNGFGTARYTLEPIYDGDPFGFGSDGPPNVVRFEQDFSNQNPLATSFPDFLSDIDPAPMILTGEFLFEYGIPFALSGSLFLSGHLQIDIDYFNTASLSLFTLPAGATLTSGSGHLYTVSGGALPPTAVPEPGSVWLLGCGLLVLVSFARSRRRAAS
jgi:hypothetical protein